MYLLTHSYILIILITSWLYCLNQLIRQLLSQMETDSLTSPKNVVKLQLRKDGPFITLSSDFDSGNMARAQIGLGSSIIITPANDCSASENPSHSKGWFYFSISGVPIHSKVKFVIRKMQNLTNQLKFSQYFKPVFRVGNDDWERVQQSMTKQDDTELSFDFVFLKNVEAFFAYSYPFSFEECQRLLKQTARQARIQKGIYFKDEIMIRTPQNRPVHLLTITSTDDKYDSKEDCIDSRLFKQGERSFQFKQNKRVILVSARVHPGQTPSSHTFNGLLKFLLSNDARAYYLRKNFVFKLVPMLNPDGVYHGHYRMDNFNQNLNRFYQSPDSEKQPAVFAMRKLGQYYKQSNKLCFYIDLHAHPQRKGNFIYGNSMEKDQQQVQTQLFARLLSLNCIEFDYFNSSFSKYHMNAKDKNEDLTKQGCGRVVFNTHFQVLYSYTMECGYTSSIYLNQICTIQNSHRKFQKFPIISDELQNMKSPYYSIKKNLYFTIKSYQNLGKNILVSILDLFEFNPASRIPHTPMKNLQGVRQEILTHINKVSMSYKEKFIRSQPKPVRMGTFNDKRKGGFMRAPSVQSSKEISFNKLRNRTVNKVNIGMF